MKKRSPCFECGRAAMHRHHVVPQSLGGRRTVWLCEACHGLVHGTNLRTSLLTKKALKRIALNGGRVGRYAQYGYRLTKTGGVVVNEMEQAVIRDICKMSGFGKAPREIALSLNASGIRSRGATWRTAMVEKILNREFEKSMGDCNRNHLTVRQLTMFDLLDGRDTTKERSE